MHEKWKYSGPKLIDETTRWSKCKPENVSIYDFQVETLEGEFTDLSQYKGHVILIVNVATFCGQLLSFYTRRNREPYHEGMVPYHNS